MKLTLPKVIMIGGAIYGFNALLLPQLPHVLYDPATFLELIVVVLILVAARRTYTSTRRTLREVLANIGGVNDQNCIDACVLNVDNTGIAINYHQHAVTLAANGDVVRIDVDKILACYFTSFVHDGTNKYVGNLIGTQILTGTSHTMNMAAAGAAGVVTALTGLDAILAPMTRRTVGKLTFNLLNAETPIMTIYISNFSFLDKLTHFFVYCKNAR